MRIWQCVFESVLAVCVLGDRCHTGCVRSPRCEAQSIRGAPSTSERAPRPSEGADFLSIRPYVVHRRGIKPVADSRPPRVRRNRRRVVELAGCIAGAASHSASLKQSFAHCTRARVETGSRFILGCVYVLLIGELARAHRRSTALQFPDSGPQ